MSSENSILLDSNSNSNNNYNPLTYDTLERMSDPDNGALAKGEVGQHVIYEPTEQAEWRKYEIIEGKNGKKKLKLIQDTNGPSKGYLNNSNNNNEEVITFSNEESMYDPEIGALAIGEVGQQVQYIPDNQLGFRIFKIIEKDGKKELKTIGNIDGKYGPGNPNLSNSNNNNNNSKRGGKKARKTRKFKKHYMWNTKGKRYMAKTYKQHLRGVKLGHTHKKPKTRKYNKEKK